MSIPNSQGPDDRQGGGKVFSWPTMDQLLPKTSIDHLISEEERQKAQQERQEFEAVGRNLFMTEEALYPVFYRSACSKLAAGVSHDEVHAEMMLLADIPDDPFAVIVRQAYEDALAGRPPKCSSPLGT
jgi:hypothetical protein